MVGIRFICCSPAQPNPSRACSRKDLKTEIAWSPRNSSRVRNYIHIVHCKTAWSSETPAESESCPTQAIQWFNLIRSPMNQLYQNLRQSARPWWSAQSARPCWSTQSARPLWSVQSARPCWSAWPRRCSNEIEQSSFHSKLHHFITIKLLISVKPYLLSGELLDLYKF